MHSHCVAVGMKRELGVPAVPSFPIPCPSPEAIPVHEVMQIRHQPTPGPGLAGPLLSTPLLLSAGSSVNAKDMVPRDSVAA